MTDPASRNQCWRLASRPTALIEPSTFRWHEESLPELGEGEVRVRVLILSLDPTQRVWASVDSYLPAVPIGDVMRSFGLGRVEKSRHPRFVEGQLVQGLVGWQTRYQGDGRGLSPVRELPGVPLDAYLALFGHIGATAYFGLLDVGRPAAGETLVVSAAAGAVGSLVGQIGKIHGLHVVGLAGSPEKCAWIVESLGFDRAIDYRTTPVAAGLRDSCPRGIDVYFDNVGGPTLEAALALMNLHGRVPLCGMISEYTRRDGAGIRNLALAISKRLRLQGFLIMDYLPRFTEAMDALGRWYSEGRLRYRVDAVEGLEAAPEALNRLFAGQNTGKLLVKVE
jgi:NADPH-dependent curcumin reductase CurA